MTLYHGTDHFNAERIKVEGLKPDECRWTAAFQDPNGWARYVPREPGHVYVTPFLDSAQNYARLRACYYRTLPFQRFYVPSWDIWVVKLDSDHRPDSRPVALEIEVPEEGLGLGPEAVSMDPASWVGIRFRGAIPAQFIRAVLPVTDQIEIGGKNILIFGDRKELW